MLALQLARRGIRPLLIDRAAARGRGIAYGTSDPAHLLNVPAGKMSAWPDEPSDFADEFRLEPASFAERRDYGDYLSWQLEQAMAAGEVEFADGEVINCSPSTSSGRTEWGLRLTDGTVVDADAFVLATGNGRPAPFAIPGWPDEAMVQDPWGTAAGKRLAEAAREGWPLLLIGTGLTMVDVVLTLDRLGYQGRVTAVSRRGQAPRPHAPGVTALPPPGLGEVPERLSDAVAWLRARGLGVDWRSAVDSLRPVSQALWASWDEATKARFARHARPWWDVHRHRIAPEAAAVLERWRSEGRLTVMAGRVREERNGAVAVTPRGGVGGQGGSPIEIEARLAINCTGPSERLAGSASPVLRQMLGDGLIAPGELGLGVRVDDQCRVLRYAASEIEAATQDERSGGAVPNWQTGPSNERVNGLWAIGPLTKGRWWEITAVPDIRVQVEQVAECLAQSGALSEAKRNGSVAE